ncbi:uncharacterized protein A1O9_02212 [Exophiala aquamarina CBS 119918]|uniref:BZIP domain-containing protein n=1 Tax=Exophiala aquamarina CBS 119918 TaxID=1182545 RepID=A0A072PL92_9EURO|nr:uncharacterized protein A1O9_02212 [Exophiala aquamarina CBS 119918]KEF60651.1 hypothetical protein A1O9_02212 [Exophiala aquamarina CBS 119918]
MAGCTQPPTRSTSEGKSGQPTASNHADASPTKPQKKPYVRRITDKRREQNRRAQKIYRERLRKRLEDLEEQAATVGSSANDSAAAFITPAPSSGSDDILLGESDCQDGASRVTDSDAIADATATKYSKPQILNLEDAFLAAGDLPISHSQLTTGLRFDVAPSPPATEPLEHLHTPDDYGDIDLRPIWAMPPSKSDKPYVPRKARPPHSLAIRPFNAQRTASSHFSSTAAASTSLADPYINHLRLLGVGSLEASLTIAVYLNIPRSAYINDHPSHFPGCYVALNSDTLGPKSARYSFFQTHLTVTPQLSEHMNAVKEPLRPSPAQLMNPHPSYLDCIVFPYFRDQTVLASVQGILDHEQLVLDILSGGLVCWGGVSDLASSRRARKRQMSDNVAWSTRSWEAKKWFLRKWSWLIGTEEEEEERGDVHGIWKGSRWWWNMRGDIDSDDEGDDYDDEGGDDDGEDPAIAESLTSSGRLEGDQRRFCVPRDGS